MHAVEDLDGINVIRLFTDGKAITLTITAPSGFTENHYYPAESFTLSGLEGIAKLHQLLGDLLDEHATLANGPAPLPPTPIFKL